METDFAKEEVGQFRKGVVEGIRRCAFMLFGIIDERVVTHGKDEG